MLKYIGPGLFGGFCSPSCMNEVNVFITHVLDADLVQIQHHEYHLVITPAHYNTHLRARTEGHNLTLVTQKSG